MLRLFALFTVIPTLELYLLFQLGSHIGAGTTIWLVIVTGFIGASMAKREGRSVMSQLKSDTQKGVPPADHLIEGLMVFAGGLLLITPGVLTDLFGFSMIFPLTRKALAPLIRKWAKSRFKDGITMSSINANVQFGQFRTPGQPEIEIVDSNATPPKTKDNSSGPTFKHPQF
jgi:UPF0716 protein FxsA